jgi:hypothetical protein
MKFPLSRLRKEIRADTEGCTEIAVAQQTCDISANGKSQAAKNLKINERHQGRASINLCQCLENPSDR